VAERVRSRPAALNPSNHEVYVALREAGCPLCRVDANSEERLLWGFARDGILNPGSRYAFVKSGGFCRRHAWGLHAICRAEGTGAPIADVYRQLARHDLEELTHLARTQPGRRGRRELAGGLARGRECEICVSVAESVDAHAAFLSELLDDDPGRSAYVASDGVCGIHLERVLAQSLDRHRDGAQARWLLEDWRERLARLHLELGEYDRKRSYTAAHEPKGEEQRSWTEVIRRYVGQDHPPASSLLPTTAPGGGGAKAKGGGGRV
jgi:Family of unknown function (DUF6062)